MTSLQNTPPQFLSLKFYIKFGGAMVYDLILHATMFVQGYSL